MLLWYLESLSPRKPPCWDVIKTWPFLWADVWSAAGFVSPAAPQGVPSGSVPSPEPRHRRGSGRGASTKQPAQGSSESVFHTLPGLSFIIAGDTCLRNPLHKQQSLPLRPIIPLVARISDQNASGAPPMTVREKTRLEKFRQLLSSHNTDLGESP